MLNGIASTPEWDAQVAMTTPAVTGPAAEGAAPRGVPRRVSSRVVRNQDLLFGATLVGLIGATVVVVMAQDIHGHGVAPSLDLFLDTIATLVSVAVAVLAWVSFREQQGQHMIYRASAFLALAVAYGAAVAESLGRDAEPATLGSPILAPTYVLLAARLTAAAVLAIGGFLALRDQKIRRVRLVLLGPVLVVVAALVVGYAFSWPPLPVLDIIAPDPLGSELPTITPLGAVVQVIAAALFFAAALQHRALWRRSQRIGNAWLAVGLLFAAFAELHWAMYPSGHPGHVATADLLRLAFFLSLLLGIEAEARGLLSRLRLQNAELARLRDAEVERAALEERARLARELHDGVAQNLWLAKLRTGQLAALPGLPDDVRPFVDEARSAIDIGLDEARQAVATLRETPHSGVGFCAMIRHEVEDFGDRFGLRVEFTLQGPHTNRVSPRTQAETLRIAQEALANVARHAEATVVGVRLTIRQNGFTLRVVDNGLGFDVAAVAEGTFGLASMRARAELICGRLRILSRPDNGTRVVLAAPFRCDAPSAVGSDR
jgi:signal transduction histidine kinase